MFNRRETATILAALSYWREEITPHGRSIARPYLRHFGLESVVPLSDAAIRRLCRRLQRSLREPR